MALRHSRAAFLLTSLAVLALLAAPPAAAAAAEPVALGAAAACTPLALVAVCVSSLDCIVVLVAGHPFAIIGCR